MSDQLKIYKIIYDVYDHKHYNHKLEPLKEINVFRNDYNVFEFQFVKKTDFIPTVSGHAPTDAQFSITEYTGAVLSVKSKSNYYEDLSVDIAFAGFYSSNLAEGRASTITQFGTGVSFGSKLMSYQLLNTGGQAFTLNCTPLPINIHKELISDYTGLYFPDGFTQNGFATTDNLTATGNTLYNLITGNGVTSLNNLSGQLTTTGAGNITITSSAQLITISGNTGNLLTQSSLDSSGFATQTNLNLTGSGLQTQINSITSSTGNFVQTGQTGVFITDGYSLDTVLTLNKVGQSLTVTGNYSNFVTNSQINSSGLATTNYVKTSIDTSGFLVTGLTGEFYPNYNPNGFITSGAINSSGLATQTFVKTSIDNSGFLVTGLTGQFYPLSNPLSFISSGQIDASGFATITFVKQSVDSSGFLVTGNTGQFYPLTNPLNFVSSGVINTSGFMVRANPYDATSYFEWQADGSCKLIIKGVEAQHWQ